MNYRTLGMIGIRLLAIWMIFSGLIFLPQVVNLWYWAHTFTGQAANAPGAWHWLRLYSLRTVLPVLIGLILWVSSAGLVRWFVPHSNSGSSRASALLLVRSAIAVAGLVIAVTSIPALVSLAVNIPGYASKSGGGIIALRAWMLLIAQAVLVLSGLGLILGARRLHNLIFRRDAVDA
ncbi:MAG: hypothetical protein L0I62_09105 [Gammaproteobacteria bacterium]|nr:hypothetical protein [Gammaproteobacteria bacterium]